MWSLYDFCSLLSKDPVGDTTSNHWLGRPSSHPKPSRILKFFLLPSPDKTEGRFSAPCALENLSSAKKKRCNHRISEASTTLCDLQIDWDWLMALEELCTCSSMNSSRSNNFVGRGPWKLIIFSRCQDSERTHQPYKKKTNLSYQDDPAGVFFLVHVVFGRCPNSPGILELHLVVDFPGKNRRNSKEVCQPCWCCTRVEKKQGLFVAMPTKKHSNQSVFGIIHIRVMIEQCQPKTIQSSGFWYKFAASPSGTKVPPRTMRAILYAACSFCRKPPRTDYQVDKGISSKHAVMMLTVIIQLMIPHKKRTIFVIECRITYHIYYCTCTIYIYIYMFY